MNKDKIKIEELNKKLESKLWSAADSLRGNISSEEYMYIVLGILFLKHISDKYDHAVSKLKEKYPKEYKNFIKDTDYLSEFGTTFIVSEKASWSFVEKYTTSKEIGKIIDDAFYILEKENEDLKGLFEKNYNREELDQNKLGQVVSEFSNINFQVLGEDVFGRIYEYFLGEFFLKQGQKGGEFYTPKSVVDLIVGIVKPKEGKIYDPTSGTGGMFVQARNFILNSYKEQGKKIGHNDQDLIAYGQEYQNKTWKLSKINLLLHGFDISSIKLGAKSADTFTEDQHKGEKFDYIMANPPFNVKKWGHEKLLEDRRWEWGVPPQGNANYAFLSHMIHKLKSDGRGATVLSNISLSSSNKNELNIRKNLIEDNYIDAIISLPDKLFYTTGIPVCIWVFNKNKKDNKNILMIEARNLEGKMKSKTNRVLEEKDLEKIVSIYEKHSIGEKVEELGFAKTINKEELEDNDFSFVPGRYVGIEKLEVDEELTKEEILELSKELELIFEEFKELIPKVKESIKNSIKK